MPLGSIQSLTKTMIGIREGKGRPAREADNLTAFCEAIV
jgi:hypothetical protein